MLITHYLYLKIDWISSPWTSSNVELASITLNLPLLSQFVKQDDYFSLELNINTAIGFSKTREAFWLCQEPLSDVWTRSIHHLFVL